MADAFDMGTIKFGADLGELFAQLNKGNEALNKFEEGAEKVVGKFEQTMGKAGDGFNADALRKELNALSASVKESFASIERAFKSISFSDLSKIIDPLNKINDTVGTISQTLTNYTQKLDGLTANGMDKRLDSMAGNIESILKGMSSSIEDSTAKATENLTTLLTSLGEDEAKKKAVSTFKNLSDGLKALNTVNWELPKEKIDAFKASLADLGKINPGKGFENLANQVGKFKNLKAASDAVDAFAKFSSQAGNTTIADFGKSLDAVFSSFTEERLSKIQSISDALKDLDLKGLSDGIRELGNVGAEGGEKANAALNAFSKTLSTATIDKTLTEVINLISKVANAFGKVQQAEEWERIVRNAFINVADEAERQATLLEQYEEKNNALSTRISNSLSSTQATALARASSEFAMSIKVGMQESLDEVNQLIGEFSLALTGSSNTADDAKKKVIPLTDSLASMSKMLKMLNLTISQLIDNVTMVLAYFTQMSSGIDMTGFVSTFAEIRATSEKVNKETKQTETKFDTKAYDALMNQWKKISSVAVSVSDSTQQMSETVSGSSKVFQTLHGNMKVFFDGDGLSESAKKVMDALDNVIQKINDAADAINNAELKKGQKKKVLSITETFNEASKSSSDFVERMQGVKAQLETMKDVSDQVASSMGGMFSKMGSFTGKDVDSGKLKDVLNTVTSLMQEIQNIYKFQAGDSSALDKLTNGNEVQKLSEQAISLKDTFMSFQAASGDMRAIAEKYAQLATIISDVEKTVRSLDKIGSSYSTAMVAVEKYSSKILDAIISDVNEKGNAIKAAFGNLIQQIETVPENVENRIGLLKSSPIAEMASTINDALASVASTMSQMQDAEDNMTFDKSDAVFNFMMAFMSLAQSISNTDAAEQLASGISRIVEATDLLNPETMTASANGFSNLSKALNGLPEKVKQFAESLKLPDGDTTISLLAKLQQIVESLGNGTADITALTQTMNGLSKSLAQVAEFMTKVGQSDSSAKMKEIMAGIDPQSVISFVNALGSLVETETKQESTGNKFAASIREINSSLVPLKETANGLFQSKNKGSAEYVTALNEWKAAMESVRTKAMELQAAMAAENVDTSKIERVVSYIEKAIVSMDSGLSSQRSLGSAIRSMEQLAAVNPESIERTVTSIRVLGEMNVTNLEQIAESLKKIAEIDFAVHLNDDQVKQFKTALEGLADDKALKSLQKTVQNLRPLLKDLFNGIADSESITKMNTALEHMDKTLQSIFNITPDSSQLMMLGDELAAISALLDGGLFKTGDDNKKVPYLAYLEKFDTSKIDEIIKKMSKLASGASIGGLSKKLTTVSEAIKSIGASLGEVKGTNLAQIMNAMSQSMTTMAGKDYSANFQSLVDAVGKLGTVQIETKQFEKLQRAIQNTTKAITDFVKSLSKMTPGQLDNLLENIITIANATGNATAQAAAQTKQKYDEMKGNLETAKHAIAGMMKGDETTFKTYSDEFLNAMTAVDEYIKTINNKDGGYHNLKTEADIIRQFQQLWTDATAAADSYKKKQDEIKANEREKRSGESITRNAQDANTRVAQIKAIASELGKLDSKDGTQFSAMETQLTGLTEAMEKWHRSTTRTKETEAIWAAYQAALVKVNSEMNRLNDMAVSAKKKEEELAASTAAAKKAEDARIQGLVKEGKAFGSLKEAMDVYLLGIREYDIKDTIPGLDNENPIERVVTWYEEGVGKLTAVFKQFVDSAGQVWYYLNDENVNKNKYNENAGVSEIVKTYQRIFDLRVKLAALGKSDTEQRSLLQGQLRDAGATLNALKAIYPEMYKIAKITGDYAKAKEKAEAAETKRTDKTNKSQESAALKQVNELLKRRYEVQKEIQTLELSMGKARSKGTIDATQRRITELKRDEANIDKEIARYDAQGVSNKQLENKYQQQLNEEKERALLKDKQSRDLQDQILSRMMSMVRNIVVMRMMRQIWTEAIKYAQEYYDKMNEIQIVTMKSSSEIAQLSTQYKAMASELKISSTDIATAAVEFWRQGLDATEVAERTKWTSQYAKITGQSFDQAATLVTASTNSMKVSAQEAVDLFTYLGDASASSGEEIGTAMQKSAAAAAAFGLDFKRLGAYIATVSEKTRQEASSIGTAFNTIIARWHSIKKSGYVTNDDGTTTGSNDITKALSDTIGVNLIDAKTGQWRDMGVVFDEIAAKWGNLNAAQKSYIATTMAGTKQQNVFLALMEDMALGAENGSRMYELYAGALDSAGTVAEKYAIYLDSVTAAQEGMNVSLQELYDVIMSGDTLKTFYNTMSDLAHLMASGLQTGVAQGAIKFTAMAGAIGTVIFVLKKLKDLFIDLRTVLSTPGTSGIMSVLTGGKLMLAVGAIAAVVAGVVALAGAYRDAHDEAKKLQELQTKQQEISTDYTALNELKSEYTSLISIANRTEEENARLKQVWEKLKTFSPTLAIALSNVSGGMENQTGVTEALNGELERLAGNYRNVANEANKLSISDIVKTYQLGMQKQAGYNDVYGIRSGLSAAYAYDRQQSSDMSKIIPTISSSYNSVRGSWLGQYFNIDQVVNEMLSNSMLGFNVAKGIFGYGGNEGQYAWNFDLQKQVKSWVETIVNAWDLEVKSGNNISLDDFIAQAIGSANDDEAVQQNATAFAQSLYDAMFDAWKSVGYESDGRANQIMADQFFAGLFDNESFIQSAGLVGEGYVEQLINALNGGQDAVNQALIALMGTEGQYKDFYDSFVGQRIRDGIQNALNTEYGTEAFDQAYAYLEMLFRDYTNAGVNLPISLPPREAFAPVEDGMAGIAEGADDASNSVETLSQKLEKVLKQQQNDVQLKALENSNFKEWFDQLNTLFGQTGDDSASLAKGVYSWMSGLNEDQLKKFLEIFPQMTPFFNDITKMGESNDFSGAADSLTGFGDALAYCSDEMLVAYQIYQEAKSGVTEDEGNGFIQQLANLVGGDIDTSSMEGLFDQFGQMFSSYTAEQQSWLMNNSDAVNQMITAWNKYKAAKERAMNAGTDSAEAERAAKDMADALDDATTAANNLRRESQKITFEKLENGQKVWSGFSDLIENASGKGKDFSDTYGKMIDRVGDLMTAQDALAYIQSGATGDAKMLKSAYSDLASYCGVSAEALATDLSPALWALQSDTLLAETTMANLVSEIFSMTGVTFDPNNMIGSLMAIANSSDETYAALANLAIKMLSLSNATIGVKDGRVVVNIPNSGSASGYKGRYTGSGGGSGGGGSSKKQKDKSKSEEEQWVGEIEKIIKRITDKMSQLKTIMNSWGDQGFLTAEIDALYEMNTLLENQDAILREKIAEAQKRLPALIDEFNRTEPETEAYDKILKRVNEIQDAIVDWTQQLTENEAEIISNNDKIKELRKSIRQLELDLENEVLQAIEDREERINDMLEARISMEEIILDILKTQAEKAEQAILDSIDAQIEALNREKDAISEILNARKEQADAEDKLVKLKELQAKYARIVADPTRAKEANSIMQEINDLRDEIAWDQAENESEAQQSSIDQQITSLEDYRDYIEQYYEDLLNNPRNFIDQVNDILKMTQEDILTWLEQNSEEYKNSSDNTRIDLVNGWTDTLNTMNGIINTHWQEVQDIIAQGEDYVIAFLKENSNQYREASKLQQEAYIEGWQEMFDNIEKAYQKMQANLLDTSNFVNKIEWGGSDDSSGSGGGSGGGGGGRKKQYMATYPAIGSNPGGTLKGYDSEAAALRAAKDKISAICRELSGSSSSMIGQWAQTFYKQITVKAYKRGGLNMQTGLAWLDGTKTEPERILNATQTKLFDSMVASLQEMNRIRVAPMPYTGDTMASKSYGYTFGDINISVEKLDTDRDLEDLAERVKESIVDSMVKGHAIGGITL